MENRLNGEFYWSNVFYYDLNAITNVKFALKISKFTAN